MKDINLIPEEYIKKKRRNREILEWTVLSSVGLVLLGVLLSLPYYVIYSLNSVSKELDSQIESFKESQADIETLNSLNSEADAHKSLIDTLSRNRLSVSELTEDVAGCVPSGLSLDSMTVNEGSMSLRGKAMDNGSIVMFALNLRSIDIVQDVSIKTSDVDENGILSFQVDVVLKGGETDEDKPQG